MNKCPEVKDLDISSISPGYKALLTWTVDSGEIERFACLSGDLNPLHVDSGYAREQGFDAPVAHGMLLGAKVSALLGMNLPGRRCLLLEESLSFVKPIFANDIITICAEVLDVQLEMRIVSLSVKANRRKSSGHGTEVVARGRALCRLLP